MELKNKTKHFKSVKIYFGRILYKIFSTYSSYSIILNYIIYKLVIQYNIKTIPLFSNHVESMKRFNEICLQCDEMYGILG